MSFATARESRGSRRLCQSCRDRKARFRYRGRVRADRDHTLCFECFRAERERQRALGLAQGPLATPVPGGSGDPLAPSAIVAAGAGDFSGMPEGKSLTERQIAHRRAMLTHLQAGCAAADNQSRGSIPFLKCRKLPTASFFPQPI